MIGGCVTLSSRICISKCCNVQQSSFRIAVKRTGDTGTISFWHPMVQTWHRLLQTSYVTCYIVINSNAQLRNTSFDVNNWVFIISLLVCTRPYIKPDTNGMILQKPHFRRNRHCLTCIHRNPEHLTLNLCCAHTFIHGFLYKSQLPTWCKYLFILARHVSGYAHLQEQIELPFIYTSG